AAACPSMCLQPDQDSTWRAILRTCGEGCTNPLLDFTCSCQASAEHFQQWIDICSPYGMACTECNDLLVAPKWSAYVSKREVRRFWSCENCGHAIEMTVNARINAASKLSQGVEWSLVG